MYSALYTFKNIRGGDCQHISDSGSDSGWSFVLKFNLRLRNGDYQNPEIVFVRRPEHKTQES